MKNLIITVIFLVTLVLGLAVSNSFGQKVFSNNAFNCFECCPLGQEIVNVRGKITGVDTYTSSLIRSRRNISVMVYEYRQNLTRKVNLNTLNYYNVNVDACETILIQPVLNGNLANTHYLYTDQLFRDLYFSPPPYPDPFLLVKDFEVEIVPIPTPIP